MTTATITRDSAVEPVRSHVNLASRGPRRPGWLSERELAERWGRSPDTLGSWRTRPTLNRDTVPFALFGIYVYYHVVDVYRFESDPTNATVRAVARRSDPFPPLFTALVQERLIESVELMQALLAPQCDDDFIAEVLEAKWQETGYHAMHACRAETQAYRALRAVQQPAANDAVVSGPDELTALEDTLDASPAQPELPLNPTWDTPYTVAAASREFDRAVAAEKSLVALPDDIMITGAGGLDGAYVRAPLSRLAERKFRWCELRDGYLIAHASDDSMWFADLSDGPLDALTWKLITALPSIAPAGEVPS